ncbi:MAG: ABC transporter permease [Clostridia bacterium]|nr:ABC transporter permease [Clostridia bacterium]
MTVSVEYFASVFNSTLRYMTPLLLITLCACVCSKVRVFNIALEGTLLTAAFFSFLAQYYVRNIYVAILVAILVGCMMAFVMGFFIVKLNGHPMIVGMALNTFAMGITTFLLSMVFHTKGVVSDVTMTGLTKITLPGISRIPVLGTMLSSLTTIDYLAFVMAIVVYVVMYKTRVGFRLRAIGINPDAASSLGINVKKYQLIAVTLAGGLNGLAGTLLTLGSVTLFVQNISSARGYVALAANALCRSHPLGALLSSALFGFTTALSYVLQNTAAKQQLLNCIPYVSTIAAMAIYNVLATRRQKARAAKTDA